MHTITFEIRSLLGFHFEMATYPELTSNKKWVQKGLALLRTHTPKILQYLSKQRVMAQLYDCKIIIEVLPHKKKSWGKKRQNSKAAQRRIRWTKNLFKIWIQEQKFKRLFLSLLESLVIPFTPILALLPGPNIFFYIPALLLYYHFTAYLGLRKVDVDDLDLEIRHHLHS